MLQMRKNGVMTLRNQEVSLFLLIIIFLVVNGGLIDIHFKTFVGFKPTKPKSC